MVEESRLLGTQLTSDLRWSRNTDEMVSKAMKKMWLLRRLKILKLDRNTILEYYIKEIRPLVEQCVPVWNSGLTGSHNKEIEKVQKVACRIILGSNYVNYQIACNSLGIFPLSDRRHQLSLNYAIKLFHSPRRDEFFSVTQNNVNTRRPKLVVEQKSRCYNAPHNYLSRLINQNIDKIIKK